MIPVPFNHFLNDKETFTSSIKGDQIEQLLSSSTSLASPLLLYVAFERAYASAWWPLVSRCVKASGSSTQSIFKTDLLPSDPQPGTMALSNACGQVYFW